MPHFIAEHTANVAEQCDFPALFEKVHDLLAGTGIFPIGGIRSRAVRVDTWRIADGAEDYAFVHMTLKIGAGRDLETRRRVGEQVFGLIRAHFAPLQARRLLALSFELSELHPELSYKHNNIHQRFR